MHVLVAFGEFWSLFSDWEFKRLKLPAWSHMGKFALLPPSSLSLIVKTSCFHLQKEQGKE